MAEAKVTDTLDASIEKAWNLIRDFGDLSAWAPGANVTQTEGKDAGMIRHIEGGDAGNFIEQCEAHDDKNHTFSYTLLEAPGPFKDYHAIVTLAEAGTDACEIEWSSIFQPVGVPDDEIIKGVEDTYRFFIENLKNTIKANG
ncbi:MAG: SRPBCC family protein [Desulfobacterales bacterium]